MLGLDNPIHIAFVLVLLLLVFGAKRLPEMGKSLGEGLRGFKDSISGASPTAHLTEAHADDPARVDETSAAHLATRAGIDERTPMQPVT